MKHKNEAAAIALLILLSSAGAYAGKTCLYAEAEVLTFNIEQVTIDGVVQSGDDALVFGDYMTVDRSPDYDDLHYFFLRHTDAPHPDWGIGLVLEEKE